MHVQERQAGICNRKSQPDRLFGQKSIKMFIPLSKKVKVDSDGGRQLGAIKVLQPGSFNSLRESVLNMRFGSNQIFGIGEGDFLWQKRRDLRFFSSHITHFQRWNG